MRGDDETQRFPPCQSIRGRRQIDTEEISAFHRHLALSGMAGVVARRPWLPESVLYQSRIKLTKRDPDRLLPDVD
jgi:hypothetical protein